MKKKAGFIVDKVEEIVAINDDNISDLPRGIKNHHLDGIVKYNDKLITVINTDKLFDSKEVVDTIAV